MYCFLVVTVPVPAVDVLILFHGLATLILEGGDVSNPSGDSDAVESLDDRLAEFSVAWQPWKYSKP